MRDNILSIFILIGGLGSILISGLLAWHYFRPSTFIQGVVFIVAWYIILRLIRSVIMYVSLKLGEFIVEAIED